MNMVIFKIYFLIFSGFRENFIIEKIENLTFEIIETLSKERSPIIRIPRNDNVKKYAYNIKNKFFT